LDSRNDPNTESTEAINAYNSAATNNPFLPFLNPGPVIPTTPLPPHEPGYERSSSITTRSSYSTLKPLEYPAASVISANNLRGFCNELLSSSPSSSSYTYTSQTINGQGVNTNTNINVNNGRGSGYSSSYTNTNGQVSGLITGPDGKPFHYQYGEGSGYLINGVKVPQRLQEFSPGEIAQACEKIVRGAYGFVSASSFLCFVKIC
jgi:hypothetical protein